MWPRLIPQMIELLPHVRRLVPLADRFFTAKNEAEQAEKAAFAALQQTLTNDMAQVAKTHAGLYRQLQDQSALIAEVSEEVKRARLAVEQYGTRVDSLEAALTRTSRLLKIGLSALGVALAVLLVLVLQLLRAR